MMAKFAVPGALVALGTAIAVLVAVTPGRVSSHPPAPSAVTPAVQQAIRLAGDDARVNLAGPGLAPAAARAMARERAAAIPLPDGGNFHGVHWPRAPATTPGELERVLQHNARCQWLRARAAGRHPGEADRVLAATAQWPALVAEGALPESRVLLECVASHREEVNFAQARGLTPSS
jgi:hypothetical protein